MNLILYNLSSTISAGGLQAYYGKVHGLTSLPCTMRWCVVIRALKTTTQLALPALSINVSAIWGTFTLVSCVAWIRSGEHRGEEEQEVKVLDISEGGMQLLVQAAVGDFLE